MKGNDYDVIILGVGSMGSAACYELAKRGCSVLGLEQFDIPHEHGSHSGQSRLIRKAYFEHPDYVPLLQKAYQNWEQLERQTGEQLYHRTGLLYHGPSHHPVIKRTKETAIIHAIPVEQPTEKYSGFRLPGNFETIYEPDAGFLQPEKVITLYRDEAIRKGAAIHTREQVVEWRKEKGHIKVISTKSEYRAKKLVITTGAWAGKTIPHLNVSLKITRQLIVWVKPGKKDEYSLEHFPCWVIADDKRSGVLYGFPFLSKEKFGGPEGMKFAWHHPAGETDPDHVDRNIAEHEINELVSEVAEYIPAVAKATLSDAKTCLYTNSADEDFIIDHLPGYDEKVIIACGFSGHGFKFVSVVGEILADLAIDGKTNLPVDFLKLERFK